jgi:hypothetical protein
MYYENMGAYTAVAASSFNGFTTPKTLHFIDEETWFVPLLGDNNVYCILGMPSIDHR